MRARQNEIKQKLTKRIEKPTSAIVNSWLPEIKLWEASVDFSCLCDPVGLEVINASPSVLYGSPIDGNWPPPSSGVFDSTSMHSPPRQTFPKPQEMFDRPQFTLSTAEVLFLLVTFSQFCGGWQEREIATTSSEIAKNSTKFSDILWQLSWSIARNFQTLSFNSLLYISAWSLRP